MSETNKEMIDKIQTKVLKKIDKMLDNVYDANFIDKNEKYSDIAQKLSLVYLNLENSKK